jgi:hypothetical protein
MPFIKLDTQILTSTTWFDRDVRDVFLTALLMAEPHEVLEPMPQLEVDALTETGFVVQPGWYGFIRAAGIGIIHRSGVDMDEGLVALRTLGNPEPESRSQDHDGRRLARVNGGYIALNYMRFRDFDYTAKERQRRLRKRRKREFEIEPTAPPIDKPIIEDGDVDWWFEMYNDVAVPFGLPRVKSITDKRRKAAQARLREYSKTDMTQVILAIKDSAFLRGEVGRATWTGATADWLLAPSNFIKVLEGNYADKGPAPDGRTTDLGW